MLVVCCSAMLLTPRSCRRSRTAAGSPMPSWDCSGGVMAPLSGFSGLAPALWATLRGYSKDEHRAVLQNFNLVVLSATFISFVVAGRARAEHLPQMAVVAGSLIRALDLRVEDLPRHEPDRVQERRAVAAGVRRGDDARRRTARHILTPPSTAPPWPSRRTRCASRPSDRQPTSSRLVCSSNAPSAATAEPWSDCSPGSGRRFSAGPAAGYPCGRAGSSTPTTLSRIPCSRRLGESRDSSSAMPAACRRISARRC